MSKKKTMSKQLIVWDLDGTIVDSLTTTLDAFALGLEPYLGRRPTHPEIMTHFGASEERILAKIVGEHRAEECFLGILSITKQHMHRIRPFDGVIETIKALSSKGYRHGIFTGRGRRGTELILEELKLRSHFSFIVTNTECENHKPHPEGLLKVCEQAGADPKTAVMLGDSPADVLAAQAVGALGIGCLWDERATRAAFEKVNAAHILDHPREIIGVLTIKE